LAFFTAHNSFFQFASSSSNPFRVNSCFFVDFVDITKYKGAGQWIDDELRNRNNNPRRLVKDTENPLEVKAGARVSAWMMLAVFIAAWVVLDRVYSITRPGILTHFHISGIRSVVAMDVLANCVQMYLMFPGSVFL